jgi:hypothetical protein
VYLFGLTAYVLSYQPCCPALPPLDISFSVRGSDGGKNQYQSYLLGNLGRFSVKKIVWEREKMDEASNVYHILHMLLFETWPLLSMFFQNFATPWRLRRWLVEAPSSQWHPIKAHRPHISLTV